MEVGDPRYEVGEVTCGGSPHLSCKRDQIKMTDSMDRRITQPKRVIKQALKRTTVATLFFLYKNIFYKNIEAEICEILRIF